jgi:hypothetical protein
VKERKTDAIRDNTMIKVDGSIYAMEEIEAACDSWCDFERYLEGMKIR